MIHERKAQDICELDVDGVSMKFSKAPEGIQVSTQYSSYFARVLRKQLGDYGHFSDCEDFCCDGNIFTDLESLPLKEGITPRQHGVSAKGGYQGDNGSIFVRSSVHTFITLYQPLCWSLPVNDDVKTLLASLSTRSTNRYLVTRVIQCPFHPRWTDSSITYFCAFGKPFVWSRNEGADSVLESE